MFRISYIFIFLLFYNNGVPAEQIAGRVQRLTTKQDAFGNKEGYKGELHFIKGEVVEESSFVPTPLSNARLVLKSGAQKISDFNSDRDGKFNHQMNLPDGEYCVEILAERWGGQECFFVTNQSSKYIRLKAIRVPKGKQK